VPTLLSYTLERRLTRNPEQFGKGAIEGVAGPEAANNAAATGTLVPLLALGLPTSATTAMMLAASRTTTWCRDRCSSRPTSGDLVWGLIASFLIGNLMLLVLNLPLVGLWVMLRSCWPSRKAWLYAGILVRPCRADGHGWRCANPTVRRSS
jgi:putative tricarboxylic transport membrane protein